MELVRKLDDDDYTPREEKKFASDESLEGCTIKKRKKGENEYFNNKSSSIFYKYNKMSRNIVSNDDIKTFEPVKLQRKSSKSIDYTALDKDRKSVKFRLSDNKYSDTNITVYTTNISPKRKNKANNNRRSQSEIPSKKKTNVKKNRNTKKNKSKKRKIVHTVKRSNSVNDEIPKYSKQNIIIPVDNGSSGTRSCVSGSGNVTFDSSCKYDVNVNFFNINVRPNHRYRLIDGRIGVCKFKGKTSFGKGGELWVGLVMEFGQGCNDGCVRNRRYFRCRDGKGEMVRPFQIVQQLGRFVFLYVCCFCILFCTFERSEVKLTRTMINSGSDFTADGKEMLEEYNMNFSNKQKLPISGFSWM